MEPIEREERERKEKELGFSVVDKRGANNPIKEPEKREIVPADNNREVKERFWTSTDYWLVTMPHPDGSMMFAGRAAALANDENAFIADYIFGLKWTAGFDWCIDAKRRLDTFLKCSCSPSTGPCPYHYRMAPRGWMKEDLDRIREEGNQEVSKVYEVLFKANQARQQAQVVFARPRR